jgi:hypothetical protein
MDNKVLYIIDPSELDFRFAGMPLQRRRDRLGEIVRMRGAEWASLRVRGTDFMAALEELDRFLAAREEFLNSAFENSPHEMLPIGSTGEYEPLFGYYPPHLVQRFDRELRTIPGAVIQRWEDGPNGDTMGSVAHAFRSTFAEAARRLQAVAVEHR